MKLKLLFITTLALCSLTAICQSKPEKDIIGIWQINSLKLDGMYEINYETKDVTTTGFMAMGSKEDNEKTKAAIKATIKNGFYGFNENGSFSFCYGSECMTGTYKITKSSTEGRSFLDLDYGSTENLIMEFKNSNPKLLITEGDSKQAKEAGMEVKQIFTYKFLDANATKALKNNADFRLFEKALATSNNKKTEAENKDQENKLRNAKEDKEKAERLRKEQTYTNKLTKSNLDLFKAIEIFNEKFGSNSIQDIIKNENIKTKYYGDNNLYQSTISIKNTELIFISDYKGKKTVHIILDSDLTDDEGSRGGYIKKKFYDYKAMLEAWAKKVKGNSLSDGWDELLVEMDDSNVKINLSIRETGDGDKSIVALSISQ